MSLRSAIPVACWCGLGGSWGRAPWSRPAGLFPNANGAGVSTSPTLACSGFGRLGRSPYPRELINLLRTTLAARSWPLFRFSVAREEPAFIAWHRCRRPVPSGGWFRSEDLSLPPGGSVTATPPCRSGLSDPLWPKPPLSFCLFRPLVKQPADCAPFAASAVRQIQTEVILRRVFRHCCGHRCQIETFAFSLVISVVSRWNVKFGITVSMI
jgi:hypothetical protein